MVKELNRTLLENVLVFSVHDNVTFKKRFAELANAEKNTTFSEGIQGLSPELINCHDYMNNKRILVFPHAVLWGISASIILFIRYTSYINMERAINHGTTPQLMTPYVTFNTQLDSIGYLRSEDSASIM